MTKSELRNEVRNISPYMTVKEHDGEIRVSILPTHIMDKTGRNYVSARNKSEAMAYYTNDRNDTLDTARMIWDSFNKSLGLKD